MDKMFQSCKRPSGGPLRKTLATGTLFAFSALISSPLLRASWAQPASPEISASQPATTQTKSYFTAEEKDVANKLIDILEQEKLCGTPVSLQVTDATIAEIGEKLRNAVPALAPLKIEQATTARFTLDLKATPVGVILSSVANLTACKFYITSTNLLIAPAQSVRGKENKEVFEWAKTETAGGTGASVASVMSKIFLRNVTHEIETRIAAITANDPTAQPYPLGMPGATDKLDDKNTFNIRFGELSTDSQRMLSQYLSAVFRFSSSARIQLSPSTLIRFASNSKEAEYNIAESSQQQKTVIWMNK